MAALAWMMPLAGLCGIVAVAYWIWRGQNPIKGLGLWPHPWAILDLGAGLVISLLAVLGIFMVEWLLGGIRIDGAVVDTAVLASGAERAALTIGWEEFSARSLQLNGLQIALGVLLGLVFGGRRTLGRRMDGGLRWAAWPAVVGGAALVGYLDLAARDATWSSALGTALGGLTYGIAFLGGRNLWLPFGLHFGWSFVLSVLGFPLGGLDGTAVVRQHPVDPASLLTGGVHGPEAGVVGVVFRFVVIGLVIGYLRSRSSGDVRFATLDFPIRSYRNAPRRPA